jgi:hypothetical protein
MKTLTSLTLIALLAAGCTHALKITKAPVATGPVPALSRPVNLGFTPVGNDQLLNAAIKAIKQSSAIVDAKEDYKPGGTFKADYVCQLSMDTKFKAAGQNFFITFPGFIVFTHAILGYKYTALLTTHSVLLDAQEREISRRDFETPYGFRHCSFARGAAASLCGWVVPGYGGAAIIPGAIFAASYDKRATSEFMDKVQGYYAPYISSEVVEQLAAAQTNHDASAAPSTTQANPVFPVLEGTEEEGATNGAKNENQYAVYLMRVHGREISPAGSSVRELPVQTREVLDRMTATGLVPDQGTMGGLLSDLGLSWSDYFGTLSELKVYTQIDDRVVPLRDVPEGTSPLL